MNISPLPNLEKNKTNEGIKEGKQQLRGFPAYPGLTPRRDKKRRALSWGAELGHTTRSPTGPLRPAQSFGLCHSQGGGQDTCQNLPSWCINFSSYLLSNLKHLNYRFTECWLPVWCCVRGFTCKIPSNSYNNPVREMPFSFSLCIWGNDSMGGEVKAWKCIHRLKFTLERANN